MWLGEPIRLCHLALTFAALFCLTNSMRGVMITGSLLLEDPENQKSAQNCTYVLEILNFYELSQRSRWMGLRNIAPQKINFIIKHFPKVNTKLQRGNSRQKIKVEIKWGERPVFSASFLSSCTSALGSISTGFSSSSRNSKYSGSEEIHFSFPSRDRGIITKPVSMVPSEGSFFGFNFGIRWKGANSTAARNGCPARYVHKSND